jgi:hypothetical protein
MTSSRLPAPIFSSRNNINSVMAALAEDNSSPSARTASVSWSVNLTLRHPTPGYPKPET